MEELEFWQAGHYGPICKGLLKKREGASSPVVVKTLRGTQVFSYQRNENIRLLQHVSYVTTEQFVV